MIIALIPARYASSRLPGKPLANIAGKTMIQRVYEQALKCTLLDKVYVATDSANIFDHVKSWGGQVVMTDAGHQTGTERCHEALHVWQKETNEKADFVINIQGDEPFILPEQIATLARSLQEGTQIATLIKKIDKATDLTNPNIVKVVRQTSGKALYFSRQALPFVRNVAQNEPDSWLAQHTFYRHIGMYAYQAEVLDKLVQLPASLLEKTEMLEQLRWLENGYSIKTLVTELESLGIDTPEDLEKARLLALHFDK